MVLTVFSSFQVEPDPPRATSATFNSREREHDDLSPQNTRPTRHESQMRAKYTSTSASYQPPQSSSQREHSYPGMVGTSPVSKMLEGPLRRSDDLSGRDGTVAISRAPLQPSENIRAEANTTRAHTKKMFLPSEGISWDAIKYHQENATFGEWVSVQQYVKARMSDSKQINNC